MNVLSRFWTIPGQVALCMGRPDPRSIAHGEISMRGLNIVDCEPAALEK